MKKIISLVLALIMSFGVFSLSFNASASGYSTGDVITFGSYPQSLVENSDLIEGLNEVDKYWVSYNYHRQATKPDVGIVADDYMQYADVLYGGEKYRAVILSMYRPFVTSRTTAIGDTYQDNNGYSLNKIYYFKYEPIEWRVLNASTGFVVSEKALDSQPFSVVCQLAFGSTSAYYNSSELTHYANDYNTSDIKEWLNKNFYTTAFTSAEKGNIKDASVQNSSLSGSKIFLLSLDEIKNRNGFHSASDRASKTTEYGKIQGVETENITKCKWWLRSHSDGETGTVNLVGFSGDVYTGSTADYTSNGIRPAMCINLPSKNSYTLTYNANGGSGAPSTQSGNTSYTVSNVKPVRSGYTFLGWSTSSSATSASYVTGNTITLNANTTLYAVWKKNVVVTPPATQPVNPPSSPNNATIIIRNPSVTTINYGDAIVLHAEVKNLPSGAKVQWSADNNSFVLTVSEDGKTCKITPDSSGDTVIKAEIIDKNGKSLSSDIQTMKSKAGFFQKIIAFFKGIFGLNKTYTESL